MLHSPLVTYVYFACKRGSLMCASSPAPDALRISASTSWDTMSQCALKREAAKTEQTQSAWLSKPLCEKQPAEMEMVCLGHSHVMIKNPNSLLLPYLSGLRTSALPTVRGEAIPRSPRRGRLRYLRSAVKRFREVRGQTILRSPRSAVCGRPRSVWLP